MVHLKSPLSDYSGQVHAPNHLQLFLQLIRVNASYQRAAELNAVVEEFENALLLAKIPIYQRADSLVHPERVNAVRKTTAVPDPEDKGRVVVENIRRAPESLVIKSVDQAWLLGISDLVADWRIPQVKNGEGTWAFSDAKPVYLSQLIARRPCRFPVLRGVATTPVISASGVVKQTPGYDEETQMLLDFGESAFPKVLDNPTIDDAKKAYVRLLNPFRLMPWTCWLRIDDLPRPPTTTPPDPTSRNRTPGLGGNSTMFVLDVMPVSTIGCDWEGNR